MRTIEAIANELGQPVELAREAVVRLELRPAKVRTTLLFSDEQAKSIEHEVERHEREQTDIGE